MLEGQAARPWRVATYNIHKGVQGLGPLQRLEIHNLRHAVAGLGADVVCLQEVRAFHRRLAQRWPQWPSVDQAQALLPPGFHSAYRSNAITRHGEHGNAVLSRWPILDVAQHDLSDHRWEQRGVLHVVLQAPQQDLHVCVVHLGLSAASRRRQTQRLSRLIAQTIPADAPLLVAGDFNDWAQQLHAPLADIGLFGPGVWPKTFPARWPVWALDRVYARGLRLSHAHSPKGSVWARWSDHRPMMLEAWPCAQA